MIETSLVRAKAVEAAVRGDLTRDYIASMSAKDELSLLMKRNIQSASIQLYEVRDSWLWVELCEIVANVTYPFADGPFGSNLKREHYTTDKEVRIIQLSNIGEFGWKNENEKYTTYEHLETIKRSEVEAGNIVIAKMMPAGRAVIVPSGATKYVLSSDCVKYVPFEKLNTRYICYAINSPMFRKQVFGGVHGIGRERTSLSKLKKYVIPLPTIEEQNLIVERLDRVFTLLDRIDLLQERYSIDYGALKNKIIDAGVRGELTEQLPEDGTAEELYEQLQVKKKELIEAGRTKKSKKLSDVTDEEKVFSIPANWTWVYLGNIAEVSGGKRLPVGRKLTAENTGHKYIRVSEMKNRTIDTKSLMYVPEDIYPSISQYIINKEDVYITVAGTIGKVGKIPHEIDGANLTENADRIVFTDLDQNWLMYCLDSSIVQKQIEKLTTQVAQPKLAIKRIQHFAIPLPPLAEQKRIAQRIDELLAALPE